MRRKDDEKEQRIRHAVIELMLQEGFNGTSIAKIARLAGVSPATVYIYYENKEEMLQDIYLEYSEEVFDYLLKGIDRNMSSAQMIETLIRRRKLKRISTVKNAPASVYKSHLLLPFSPASRNIDGSIPTISPTNRHTDKTS